MSEKINKKWFTTWWGIPLMMAILIFFILLFFLLTKDCNCPKCPKLELTEKNIECPKLDCSTCPTKTETRVETKTITEKIFVCEDLTEVENKEDCVDFTEDGWYEVKTITANSTIKSEPIIITENIWRYTWSCKSTASINNQDVSLVYLVFCDINATDCDWMSNNKSVIFSSNCVSGDTSYVYNGKGTYYLDISGANFKDLEVKIEAKK